MKRKLEAELKKVEDQEKESQQKGSEGQKAIGEEKEELETQKGSEGIRDREGHR